MELRQRWTAEVEARLRSCRDEFLAKNADDHWQKLCSVCREVSFEVCGVMQSHKGAPWLVNKGGDIQRLDSSILWGGKAIAGRGRNTREQACTAAS